MACFNPLSAYRSASGEVLVVERGEIVSTMSLPCGRCVGCRLERARQWSVRVMHEAQTSSSSCFITLTYDDAHCPSDRSINYGDFQRFMRRVRKHMGADRKVRFFACGEYGDEFDRPHFHAALFGVDWRPWKKWRKSPAGFQLFRSSAFEAARLWTFGNVEFGTLTTESAAYIARYSLKKVTGDDADWHYRSVDVETGQVTWRTPEMVHMSLKPGIGADWFNRYHGDVYPHDRVVVGGIQSRPPRYYDVLMKRKDRDLIEELRDGRAERARERYFDNTDARLAVKEKVALARVSYKKRTLK